MGCLERVWCRSFRSARFRKPKWQRQNSSVLVVSCLNYVYGQQLETSLGILCILCTALILFGSTNLLYRAFNHFSLKWAWKWGLRGLWVNIWCCTLWMIFCGALDKYFFSDTEYLFSLWLINNYQHHAQHKIDSQYFLDELMTNRFNNLSKVIKDLPIRHNWLSEHKANVKFLYKFYFNLLAPEMSEISFHSTI